MTPAAKAAAEFVQRLVSRGVSLGLRGNRLFLSPGQAYADLSPDERATLREHRAAIKELIRTAGPFVSLQMQATAAPAPEPQPEQPEPTPQPQRRTEPEPVVMLGSYRITEQDVRSALEDLGDEMVADYEAGRLTKREAYELARAGLRHGGGMKDRDLTRRLLQ